MIERVAAIAFLTALPLCCSDSKTEAARLLSVVKAATGGAVGAVYVAAFAYLFPDRRHAEVQAKDPQTTDGKQFDIVLVSPRGSDPFELWIERATHRVMRVVQIAGVDKMTNLFSDFREIAGVTVPFKMVQSGAKAAGPAQSWQLVSVDINVATPTGVFDPPPARF